MNEVFIELDDEMMELFDKLERISVTNYERKGNFIDIEGLKIALRDLMVEYDNLEEKYNEE